MSFFAMRKIVQKRHLINTAMAVLLLLPLPGYSTGSIPEETTDHHCAYPHATHIDDIPLSQDLDDYQATPIDLSDIQQRGYIRILFHQNAAACSVSKNEKDFIEKFALENGLETQWIYVEKEWQLMPNLLDSKADIIVANGESLTAGISGELSFTLPWAISQLKIVDRADTSQIDQLENLTVRQVALKRSSPAWPLIKDLAEKFPGMGVIEIPVSMNVETVMQRIASGEYDVTIADSLFLNSYLPSHPELSATFNVSEAMPLSWAVKKEAEELLAALDQFLNKNHLSLTAEAVFLEDLPEIQQRRSLRLITYQSPAHYYLDDGKLNGFEYELVKYFAAQHKLRVDVVLASSEQEMFELLRQGKGDLVAASLPSTHVEQLEDIDHSRPYNYSAPVIVGRKSGSQIIDLRDLEGRRITLPAESPYFDYLSSLKRKGFEFELVRAGQGINTETALFMVGLGMYDLTVVGSHQLNGELVRQISIQPKFTLSEPVPLSWAVRSSNRRLLGAVNRFIENEYRSEFYNLIYGKYFERPIKIRGDSQLLVKNKALSPFDDIVRIYAEKYGFDWRLIAAVMYQESQFNPDAHSYAGAEGLMQLIPETAELMGVKNVKNPEDSIKAGVKYLDYLRGRFEKELLLEDRTWFSLASYNAGYGRVKRARVLAARMGLDEDRWFDNVEQAMLMMAKPIKKDGEVVRACRCGQTAVYVREIKTRYHNYRRLTEATQLALRTVENRAKQFN